MALGTRSTDCAAARTSAKAPLKSSKNVAGNRTFVFHPPTPSDFANGEFDDQLTWITVGEFYGRLVAAGVLP